MIKLCGLSLLRDSPCGKGLRYRRCAFVVFCAAIFEMASAVSHQKLSWRLMSTLPTRATDCLASRNEATTNRQMR